MPAPSAGTVIPIPFTPATQLCTDLTLQHDASGVATLQPASSRPSQRRHLPGQPAVALDDREATAAYLDLELRTPKLDAMAPYLWLVATPSSAHVTALHAQRVRGRDVVLTEDPDLHLVWIDGRVFVKPLPAYLLSHAFWTCYLDGPRCAVDAPGADTSDGSGRRAAAAAAARGFLRSYHHLIRHESDFRIAKEAHLLPQNVRFSEFVAFSAGFGAVADADVSPRYHYGELRLSRLNMWAKPLLRRWQFHKVTWQYADYFARLYAPLLFAFAACSVVLSALQLGVAVSLPPSWTTAAAWAAFGEAAAVVAVMTLAGVALVALVLLVLLTCMVGRETVFAVRAQLRARWERGRWPAVQEVEKA